MFYPVFLNIKKKPCLVVGGGTIAYRKVKGLVECEADVLVVSNKVNNKIYEILPDEKIRKEKYNKKYCTNKLIVIAATDQEKLNIQIYKDARKAGALVNVVDNKELCDFIMPAVVNRGDLKIAISTGGNSPALAKKIREDLEGKYKEDYQDMNNILGEIREIIKKNIDNQNQRKIIFDKLASLVKLSEYIE